MTKRQMTLGELFTVEELTLAKRICRDQPVGQRNAKLVAQVVEPVMTRIDRLTGQKNDPRYLGYMIEHAYDEARKR